MLNKVRFGPYRRINPIFCKRLSSVEGFVIHNITLLGSVNLAKMSLKTISKKLQRKHLSISDVDIRVPNLFLVEGVLPSIAVQSDVFLNMMVGGVKHCKERVSLYILIHPEKIVEFMSELPQELLPYRADSLGGYGNVVLARVNNPEFDGKYCGGKFVRAAALRYVAGITSGVLVQDPRNVCEDGRTHDADLPTEFSNAGMDVMQQDPKDVCEDGRTHNANLSTEFGNAGVNVIQFDLGMCGRSV